MANMWRSGYDATDEEEEFNPNVGQGSVGNPIQVGVTGTRDPLDEPYPDVGGHISTGGMQLPSLNVDTSSLGSFNPGGSNDIPGLNTGAGQAGNTNVSSGGNNPSIINNAGGGNGLSDIYRQLGLETILPMVTNAISGFSNADSYRDTAREASGIANPFGDQRGYYSGRLRDLYNNPDSIKDTPGYQFALSQGLGAVNRSDAANGYLGAGKMAKDEMDYASGLASQTYNTEANRLSQLAGSQFDPANGANMLMHGNDQAIMAQNASLNSLTQMFNSLFGAGNGQGSGTNVNINNAPSVNATGGSGGGGGSGGQSQGGSSNSGGSGSGSQGFSPNDIATRIGGGAISAGAAQYLRSQGIDPTGVTQSMLNEYFSTGQISDGMRMVSRFPNLLPPDINGTDNTGMHDYDPNYSTPQFDEEGNPMPDPNGGFPLYDENGNILPQFTDVLDNDGYVDFGQVFGDW